MFQTTLGYRLILFIKNIYIYLFILEFCLFVFFFIPIFYSYHFEVDEVISETANVKKLEYTHVLSKGVSTENHYGRK